MRKWTGAGFCTHTSATDVVVAHLFSTVVSLFSIASDDISRAAVVVVGDISWLPALLWPSAEDVDAIV